MRHRDLDPVGKKFQRHNQMRMVPGQMSERLSASSYNRLLQLSHRFARKLRGLREVARSAPGRRRQPLIRVNLQFDTFGLSAHCDWSPATRRKLPGNPGNSIVRLRRALHLPALCKSCSTFHRCTALPACHTACKRRVLASRPPIKLYLTQPEPSKLHLRPMPRFRNRLLRRIFLTKSSLPCFLSAPDVPLFPLELLLHRKARGGTSAVTNHPVFLSGFLSRFP